MIWFSVYCMRHGGLFPPLLAHGFLSCSEGSAGDVCCVGVLAGKHLKRLEVA